MAELTEDTAQDLLEALNELRRELLTARRQGFAVRLSEAEREEIARSVYERVDARLAPADSAAIDDSPRVRRRRR